MRWIENLWKEGMQMKKPFPRLLIAGTNSGCGKTSMVCAVLQALKNRNVDVHPFKCGPDYIDPMFHSKVMGLPCRNLDLHFFDENTLRYLLAKNGGSLALLEGVMGYYDGVGMTSTGSSYEIAAVTNTPAVLVVNARGAAHSLLATISGFVNLYENSGIRGVLFNQCSPMLYPKLKAMVEEHFGGRVKPLGYLPVMEGITIESRHLGLVTAQEIGDLQQKLDILAAQAEKSIDLDGLLSLAASAPELEHERPELPKSGSPVRIAVAQDKAFCFYYADSLNLLEELGAELVPFSPMEDSSLPEDIQGLYLGGGYPELYEDVLAGNISMRESIKATVAGGLPTIAECGGFLYLHSTLEGKPMAGLFPGDGINTGKLRRFGYVTLQARKDNLLCKEGQSLPAHEFHYFDVPDPGADFEATKASGQHWLCAHASKSLYAGFPHFHFYSAPAMAGRFLNACRENKEKGHD